MESYPKIIISQMQVFLSKHCIFLYSQWNDLINNSKNNLTLTTQLILIWVAQMVSRRALGSDSQGNALKTIVGCFLGVVPDTCHRLAVKV